MGRATRPADHRAGPLVALIQSPRVVGTGLLAVLGVAVLGSAAGGPAWIRTWPIAGLLVVFAGVLIVGRYLAAQRSDVLAKPPFVDYQLVLLVGLLGILYQSRTPGYGLGIHPAVDAAGVFVALVAFCVLAGDPRRYDDFQWLVLGGFAVVAGILFYHSVWVPAPSARARQPLWWSVTAGVCLVVLPQYVSREAFLWAVSRLAAALVVLGLPVYLVGAYSVFGVQVGFHGSVTVPLVEVRVRAIRSLFPTGTALATVVIAGLVAAVAEVHRAVERGTSGVGIAVAAGLCVINAVGLVLSVGLAAWVVTPVVLGIYLVYLQYGRRAVPVAVVLAGVFLASGILVIYTGVLAIDVGGRFRLWSAGIRAIIDQRSLLGEGLVAPAEFIVPYHAGGEGPRTAYLSIWIRTGVLGGGGYLGIVGTSLLRGLWRYRDTDVAVLALAVGYACLQLFVDAPLFGTSSSSILAALAFGMVAFGGQAHARHHAV